MNVYVLTEVMHRKRFCALIDGVKHVSCGWNMHGNDMQMRLCRVKLGVVSSIYGDFWDESGWRCTYTQSSPDWDL